ncbi:HPr family phosphocarrier protein [Mesorhizobium sp. BH1-1-5]|uniref:HPr family phosphocarrier protein n=1 Tax=unclassified Mesorhizobium TaxID=325217 RepID=UPI00112E73C0|nr:MULTISPECIES: HPr family phosphocarrier protein [unclassified Mesorhizobium]MBZ9991779.1 HPr family phosphocarrier protein [Mesorhizobium sp. BH1-1-5]TPJ74352.1 HPr family phosphocarrier protein [Mesorhizobium sp. B2-7-1]
MNAPASATNEVVREFPIINQRGLHARASAKFVQVASGFDATIHVEKDGVKVGGTSIMGLMMLAASPGYSIRVIASGPEAVPAMDALEQLVASRFGEEI